MNTAHDRITRLLDRWHASVERHTHYLSLDDAAYQQVEDWPRHQRPARWVVEHARSRLLELRRIVDDRRTRGDADFAEALELMAFLANLVGAEHVERHIPLARGAEAATATEPTVVAAPVRPPPAAIAAPPQPPPATVVRQTRPPTAAAKPAAKAPRPDKAASQVIADAARLLSWGREWPQLAGLIARMADRPPEQEVWTILRAHRATIERRARRAPD
jgi:hypothetical protein